MGWYIARSGHRPPRMTQQYALSRAIADGDPTRHHITTDHKDETGVLPQSINGDENASAGYRKICGSVNGSESISTAVAQIVAGNRDLAARTGRAGQLELKKRRRRWNRLPPRLNTADHTSEATKTPPPPKRGENNGEMMNRDAEMRVINDTAIVCRISSISLILLPSDQYSGAERAVLKRRARANMGVVSAVVAGEVRQLAQKQRPVSQ